MQEQESPVVFDEERASNYEQHFDRLAPTREALYLLIKVLLGELPTQAHVLCVGAGTGLELIALAQEFPQWHFTAVEPAAPMLDICRKKAEESGIASRCTFHLGYLDSLPPSPPFDAAVCLLVSHFLVNLEARREFFAQIASRLHPQGLLVNSDLTAPPDSATFERLQEVWFRMLRYSGVPESDIKKFRTSFGKDVTLLLPRETESLLTSSGFETPTLFYQTFLIHAWYSRRS